MFKWSLRTINLLKPNRSWLHPELDQHIEGIASLIDLLDSINYVIPDFSMLSDSQIAAINWFENLPRYAQGKAISVPFLHPNICDKLIEYTKNIDFKPNVEEQSQYQIAEYVLADRDPELFNSIVGFAENSLFLIYNLFWGKFPSRVDSVQLAKYVPTEFGKTEWHHDRDSNMTGVVNLAPELYENGGTDIRTGILTFEHIPPVPKGNVLIFNGNMTLHRGAEVKSGERYLLVFWVTTDRN